MYNLFDESRHVTGDIYPGDKRTTLCFFVHGKTYQAPTVEVRSVLLGELPTAGVTGPSVRRKEASTEFPLGPSGLER
jgi:hypothetical protein